MKNNSIEIGKIIETGKDAIISLDDIIEDKALIQANSRGGKSYFVRKFCEKSFGKVQIIIIDPEGEYSTLREQFDFLLIGSKSDGADIPISVKIAEMLANKLLEDSISAIVDLSELIIPDQIKFVKNFVNVFGNQNDKKLWHPVLIIQDEAHVFAPEKGYGEAESLEAILALASKGGKRGYSLIAATQRPAKLSKNVTNELNTKFIGRAGGYDDIQRAKQELGLPKSTPDSMFRVKHEFFALGPAISDEVIRIKADPVVTTHKKNSLNYKTKTATPEGIKKLLSKFEGLPEEAEKELKTKEELKKKILELEKQIIVEKTLRTHQEAKLSPQKIQELAQQKDQEYRRGFNDGVKKTKIIYEEQLKKAQVYYERLKLRIGEIFKLSEQIHHKAVVTDAVDFKVTQSITEEISLPPAPKPVIVKIDTVKQEGSIISESKVTIENPPKGGAMRLLKAVKKFYPKPISRNQACFIADLSPTSGTTSTYISELRSKQLIKDFEEDSFEITPLGIEVAGEVTDVPITNEGLQNMWIEKQSGKTKDILKHLIEIYPDDTTVKDLAETVGMVDFNGKPTGSFQTYLSGLNAISLAVKRDGRVKASKDLFPEMFA